MPIGIAISGGGHRATVWGLGATMAVVDAGLGSEVTSISSVSGGSIANGVIAHEVDLRTVDGPAFERALAPSLRLISSKGLFFHGASTDGFVRQFFFLAGLTVAAVIAAALGFLAAGFRGNPWWWLLVDAVIVVAVLAFLAKKKLAGGPAVPKRKPNPIPTATLAAAGLGVLMAGPLTVLAVWFTSGASGWWQVAWRAFVLVLVVALIGRVALVVFGRRSEVVESALSKEMFNRNGTPTGLADVDRPVHHVFCSTELQTGDHCYFSPKVITTYRLGAFKPDAVLLSTAVQSSACLPGGFVPRVLPVSKLGRPQQVGDRPEPPKDLQHLVLNDGGVYDNMADQWELGFRSRLRDWPGLADLQPEGADLLMVVNSGGALGFSQLPMKGRIAREVKGLSRTIDILYDVSTSVRRAMLRDTFVAYEELSEDARGRLQRSLNGMLVHVATQPERVPSAYSGSWVPDSPRKERALEALEVLELCGLRGRPFPDNGSVPTTLGPLGAPVTAALLRHSYVLATVGLYVIHGLGSLAGAEERFALARFERLAAGS
jgi:hypothetical protein